MEPGKTNKCSSTQCPYLAKTNGLCIYHNAFGVDSQPPPKTPSPKVRKVPKVRDKFYYRRLRYRRLHGCEPPDDASIINKVKPVRIFKKKFAITKKQVYYDHRSKSRKYKDLTVIQEVCLDFIIDYIMHRGVAPNLVDISIGMGYTKLGDTNGTVKYLIRKGYLERTTENKDRRFFRIGPRVRDPLIRVLFEKIYVGPLPKRMTAEDAIRIGKALAEIGEKLKAATAIENEDHLADTNYFNAASSHFSHPDTSAG